MLRTARSLSTVVAMIFLWVFSGRAAEMRALHGHVPAAAANLRPLGPLAGASRLRLAISLPLRNQAGLDNFLRRLYDPASPDYHHYLSPKQFREQFGPTDEDYAKIVQFAQSNGFDIATRRGSRMVLDVNGRASDVEKAFHVKLNTYQYPAEKRQFFAPDTEPSVEAGLPILDVCGLNNFATMRSRAHRKLGGESSVAAAGSGPGGLYIGKDFSNAYTPGVALTGAGQMVGLVEFDGYYVSDITNYEAKAGLPNVPLINVPLDSFGGPPGLGNLEVSLDIEMAIAIAPGLSGVVVFEAPDTGAAGWVDILDSMASSNQISQFSSSWGYLNTEGPDPNVSMDAQFQKMAAQGQTFFQASGDGDAWVNPVWVPADSPYVTSVGGTSLAMSGAGLSYSNETVWNAGNIGLSWGGNGSGNDYWGSGGGVSTVYSIPAWQQGLGILSNGCSTNMRNIPDVAMPADNIFITFSNGQTGNVFGTSCAAPLWAGFAALANQQASANDDTNIGFINPALYSIGESTNYSACFHDITNGCNTNAASHNLYQAVLGYDLCTGWGTPLGSNLINALAPLNVFRVFPAAGFAASGAAGGPFSPASQTYYLTNTTADLLMWSTASSVPWLTVSPPSGIVNSGGPVIAVTVSLNAAASNELAGVYNGVVWFTNITGGTVQNRAFALNVLAPPVITSVTGNQTPISGTTATFSVTATGGAPLAYQWRRNRTNLIDGVNIVGSSTSSLTIPNVDPTNAGSYTVVITNSAGAVTSAPPSVLVVFPSPQLVQNGGFETGTFSSWTLSGNSGAGGIIISSLASFVHSGQWGAKLGPSTTPGYLSQTLATFPSQTYLLSFWIDTGPAPANGTEFSVAWDGGTIFDQTNFSGYGWTNMQFTLPATNTSTVLSFGFRNDPAFYGFDDVSVMAEKPVLLQPTQRGGLQTFFWNAIVGGNYQVQYTTNLNNTNWISLGGTIAATNVIMTTTNAALTNGAEYFRVLLVP
jgi:hypothetical protein